MNPRKIELIIKVLLFIIYVVCGWAAILGEQWGRVILTIIGIVLLMI